MAPALSVTCTVKLEVPFEFAGGVPLSTPAELRPSQDGNCVPPVVVQFVYGGVPPLAASVCE